MNISTADKCKIPNGGENSRKNSTMLLMWRSKTTGNSPRNKRLERLGPTKIGMKGTPRRGRKFHQTAKTRKDEISRPNKLII